jgi:hypothetical protein
MTRVVLAIAIFAAIPSVSVAQTAVEKARLGRTMWSAFQCSTFADMSDNGPERARLFAVGLKAGHGFIDALVKSEVPREVLNSEVPWGVLTMLQGPTPDFMIGRVYENAAADASNTITKSEGKGVPSDQWKQIAANEYTRQNCSLLR